MNYDPDRLTAQDARQRLGERVPGFLPTLASAMGVELPDLFRMLENGEVKKLDAIEALARRIISDVAPIVRQTGFTSRQMQSAPKGAAFVWCNSHLYYPQKLAQHLGRTDLEVRPLQWLLNMPNLAGSVLNGVVVDHAAPQSSQLSDSLNWLGYRGVPIQR